MSFILDALRRAEAERRRGTTPALHQVPLDGPSSPASAGRRVWPWALATLQLAAGAAAIVWWWLARPDPPRGVTPALPAQAAAASATPPAAASPRTAPPPPPPSVPVATPVVAKPPPARPPAVPAPTPGVAAASAPVPAARASVAAPQPASTAPAGPLAAQALPEPLRGAVLRLQVGGVVHSQDRSQSFVLVGGQIAREGDTLAPGITLEHIAPRWLLLRVAGQLVTLPL